MGTHAMIGVYNKKDGSVTASYCHYDGYLEGVGRTLVESYNTQYDAEVVSKGGYISSLNEDYFVSRTESVHQDAATIFSSPTHFFQEGADYAGADYLYLFDGNAWFFCSSYDKKGFEEVEMNLKKAA